MKTTLLEDNLTGRQACRKTSSQEDDLTGRQPHRKTNSKEDDLTGRPSHRKMDSQKDELGTAQPQLVIIFNWSLFNSIIYFFPQG